MWRLILDEGLTLYLDANVIFASSRGGPEKAIRHIMNVGPDDLVLAISTSRAIPAAPSIWRNFAKDRGATVLALTDAPSSPLVPHRRHDLLRPGKKPAAAKFTDGNLRARRCHRCCHCSRAARCRRGFEGTQRKSSVDVLSVNEATSVWYRSLARNVWKWQCAPKARITSGGGFHPESCRLIWSLTSGSAG